jgi:hypothetical protein
MPLITKFFARMFVSAQAGCFFFKLVYKKCRNHILCLKDGLVTPKWFRGQLAQHFSGSFPQIKLRQQIGRAVSIQAVCQSMMRLEGFL